MSRFSKGTYRTSDIWEAIWLMSSCGEDYQRREVITSGKGGHPVAFFTFRATPRLKASIKQRKENPQSCMMSVVHVEKTIKDIKASLTIKGTT